MPIETNPLSPDPTLEPPSTQPPPGTTPTATPDLIQQQMAQMAQAISAIAESQQKLNQTAEAIMQQSQPEQRYLSSLEQQNLQQPQQQQLMGWDDMTQAQMAEAIMGVISQNMARAGSQYGEMLKTILPEHEVWAPEFRDNMAKHLKEGIPFEKAYQLVKNKNQQSVAKTPEEVQTDIDTRVKAELDKRETARRARLAGVGAQPGRNATEAATLSPREQLHQDYQRQVVEGQPPEAETVRGL